MISNLLTNIMAFKCHYDISKVIWVNNGIFYRSTAEKDKHFLEQFRLEEMNNLLYIIGDNHLWGTEEMVAIKILHLLSRLT